MPAVDVAAPGPPGFAELRDEALACTGCRLADGRTQVVFGMGDPNADLMFVGEGPGAQEDLEGLPFVGRSGQLLDRLMAEEMGITRDACYIANVVKCRPPDNRDPKPDEISACRPWLEAQIDLIGPRVIVTLGNFSSKLLLDTTEGITRIRGSVYQYRARPDGVMVQLVPTFHPAAVLRGGGEPMAKMRSDLVRAKQVLTATPVADGGATDPERPIAGASS